METHSGYDLEQDWGRSVGSWVVSSRGVSSRVDSRRGVGSWVVSSSGIRNWSGHIWGCDVGCRGDGSSNGVVHNVLIVGGGVRSDESCGNDSSGGDSEESEDGGELEGKEWID